MKKYLICKKEIIVDDKNSLCCSHWCQQHRKRCTWVECALNDEKLVSVADGKPFYQTFLRTGECLEREMKSEM